MRHHALKLSAALAAMLPAQAHAVKGCEELRTLALPKASVTAATVVPAGIYPPEPAGGAAKPMKLPSYCRVEGVARPTSDSEIKFEVWLPVGEAWNGKFQQMALACSAVR